MQTSSNKTHLFALLAAMLTAGVLLAVVSAHALLAANDVSVGVTVVGPPLTIGATILTPSDGQTFSETDSIVVSGTCEPGAYTVVESNGNALSSMTCAEDGTFSLRVQPFPGSNVLTAFDYDVLNNAGPATPSVTITFTPPVPPISPTEPVHPSTPVSSPPAVSLPANPTVVPGVPPSLPGLTETASSCDNYQAPTAPSGGQARLAIVCLPRIINSGETVSVGIFLYGGAPPYQVTVNWGNSVQSTYTATTPGYHVFSVMYENAGLFTVNASAVDANGNQALSQAAIRVVSSGTPIKVASATSLPWYESSAFWEIAMVIGLFIFVIVLIIYYVRRAS